MMTTATASPTGSLRLVRLPGEFGPIVRCAGELTVATVEALRRELEMLMPLGHPVLTLSLTGCAAVDVEGILVVLDAAKRLQDAGRRLVLVAGQDVSGRILHVLGIDSILPVFPAERTAALALRGGGAREGGPATWREARTATLAWWRAISDAMENAPVQNLLRPITAMHGLCERSDEVLQEATAHGETRCQVCPLFHALGGSAEDVGCRSLKDPIVTALLAGDRAAARAQVDRLIQLVETMPLPTE
jgi:anti-anti-sigma factor